MAIAVLSAWALARGGVLRDDLAAEDATRVGNLDGLRGILASSVYVHHTLLIARYNVFGDWAPPIIALTLSIGTAPVAMFFMITAFLFWTRALKERGRLNAGRLYRTRFERLWPLFAGSIVLMLVINATIYRSGSQESPFRFIKDVAQQFLFGFFSTAPVNGSDFGLIDAGVTWSLAYEVAFYVALPLLALSIAARCSWAVVLIILGVPLVHHSWWMAVAFVPGILAAEVIAWPAGHRALRKYGATIAIASLSAFILYQWVAPHVLFDNANKPTLGVGIDLILLGLIFIGIVPSDHLGILRSRALRYLGLISYSIYLFHGIVIFLLFHAYSAFAGAAILSMPKLFILAAFGAALTVGISTLTYRMLERPFIRSLKGVRSGTTSAAVMSIVRSDP